MWIEEDEEWKEEVTDSSRNCISKETKGYEKLFSDRCDVNVGQFLDDDEGPAGRSSWEKICSL